jgi:Plant transposon protein
VENRDSYAKRVRFHLLTGQLLGELPLSTRTMFVRSLEKSQVETIETQRCCRQPAELGDPKGSVYWLRYWKDKAGVYSTSESYRGKHFRRVFRMSKADLQSFVEIAVEEDWFPEYNEGRKNAAGRAVTPLPLLIMGSLSALGGLPFHHLEPLTNVSESTHRRFFDKFCTVGASNMAKRWISPPRSEDELRRSVSPYAAGGLPGAFACTDGVRIRLWSASYSLRNQHVGKEGYPVRTYNVTVGHTGLIYAVTLGWPGKEPDVKIAHYDEFFKSVKNDSLFTDFEWTAIDSAGVTTTHRGAWILVDGGYPDWIQLQAPPKSSSGAVLRWARIIESLRKDVERAFGILKQRFRILKTGVGLERFAVVDKVFHTCCAIHNYLVYRDGQTNLSVPLSQHSAIMERMYKPRAVTEWVGAPAARARKRPSAFLARQRILVDHFDYMLANGLVVWPSRHHGAFVQRRLDPFTDNDEYDDVVNYDLSDVE